MSIHFQWKIEEIERTANEAKRRLYELDSLCHDMGRLEHSLREIRAEVIGLRDELQTAQEKLRRLET